MHRTRSPGCLIVHLQGCW